MEPNFWALFLKKNCAKGFKKSPKWRKIAQSGHTANGDPSAWVAVPWTIIAMAELVVDVKLDR